MKNRIVIKSVSVKNFRSIRNEEIQTKDLNIFVGLNDAGKSNFLKALNLFFNTQTDYNTPFDFRKDFTFLFPKSSHSTKEIKISIKFIIPDTYKESGEYTWTKVWRTGNYSTESFQNSKGDKPSEKSRVPSTLKRIRYRYVPAVKSTEYYKTLLSDLYEAASHLLDNPLHESTQSFSDSLRSYTAIITDNVFEKLQIKSELSVPSNLSDIFKALVFITKSDAGTISVPLSNRGDGIQARHIPIILKYIAGEDQKSRNQGSMKVTTIWGFEEPENGLELSRAFEMSSDFSEYSQEIQIFATTHSPAFYMKKDDENSIVYFVRKKESSEETNFIDEKNSRVIDQQLGLMPLVAPYIAEQEEKVKQAQLMVSRNILCDIDTIAVEGKTDKAYISKAIELFSNELSERLKNGTLRILTKDEGCGTTQLCDWGMAWIYSGYNKKLFVLFDKDNAGKKAKGELDSSKEKLSKAGRNSNVKTQYIKPTDNIKRVLEKMGEFTFSIEHLLSIEMWNYFAKCNYLSERAIEEIITFCNNYCQYDKTIADIVEELIDDVRIRETIVTYEIHKDKKVKALNAVFKYCSEKNCERSVFEGFSDTIKMIEASLK